METPYLHEFRKGFETILEIECTSTEARRKGDELANEHGTIEMFACDGCFRRWKKMTTFLGNRRVLDMFGNPGQLDEDYRNIWLDKKGAEQ